MSGSSTTAEIDSEAGPGVRASLVGFAVALVVLAVLVAIVGVDRITAVLGSTRPRYLAGVGALAIAWLTAWGLVLSVLLGQLGHRPSRLLVVGLYTSIVFADNVTPFGQLGGEPLAALVVSRAVDTDYETSLAAVAGVDLVNLLPSSGLVLFGLAGLTLTADPTTGLVLAGLAVVTVALGVPAGGALLWGRRERIVAAVATLVATASARVARFVPGAPTVTTGSVTLRLGRFNGNLERLLADRRRLAVAVGLSAIGWLCLAGSLWLSLRAVDAHVSFAVAMFVVPVSMLAVVVPLPGGTGGVETTLVVLLVATAGLSPAIAAAATVIHRGGTYLLPTLLGGVAIGILQSR